MEEKIKSFFRPILAALVLCCLVFIIPDALFELPVEKLQKESSTIVTGRNGEILRAFITSDDKWRVSKNLDEVSPLFKKLLLLYEDNNFYYHPGVNPFSILRALWQNISAGRVISGGSTITMQLARMMDARPRTVRAKIIEAFRAFQLELAFSKDEILCVYLNLAPYGGNIEGVGAAARLYFGKDAREISLAEAALLVALPNSPTKTRPDRFAKAAVAARNKVLKILHDRGNLSDTEYIEALNERVPHKRKRFPFRAPHLARLLKKRNAQKSRINSTIDIKIQKLVDDTLARHVSAIRGLGITQAAAVVLENSSGEILAMTGSNDFYEDKFFGQVNGALAPRSPGSTLKPFLYALALDRGLATPDTMLQDIPVSYGAYSPENYDSKFRGMSSLKEALRFSLNVPAVNMLSKLGRDGLYPFLKKAGVTTLRRKESEYGLAMILGGCEMNLLELVNLYSMLASEGMYSPYSLTAGGRQESKRLLSKGASFLITEILAEVRRPDLPDCWEFAPGMPKVAWKTGTSYGHRDAWSVGFNRKYTVGVWTGNFAGAGAAALVGSKVAAPLLFDIFHILPKAGEGGWFKKPESVGEREICVLSGKPAGADCPKTKNGYYIKNVSPITKCNMHIAYDIDDANGYRLCSRCRVGRKSHREIFEIRPPAVEAWMLKNGYPLRKVPEHYPSCTAPKTGGGPVIKSPKADCEYVIRKSAPLEYQKIKLEAAAPTGVKRLFWFVDGELFWSGVPGEDVFYTPTSGNHTFVCSDDLGRSSKVSLIIK